MARDFDAFAARLTAPLTGLAQLLTGDRETAAALVHLALTRAYSERTPDERRAVTTLVRAWLAGAPPVGEPAELTHDLELLRRSLDALPEKQRVAVALHHWSGLPVRDIAAMLRRPERVVAADLEAGVAALHLPADPDEPPPTVDARLAALVAAAGPPLVDVADVAEAGRRQRRHRRRTAVAAVGVLVAAGVAAALLTGGDPEPSERTPVRVVDRYGAPPPEFDARARQLTAQLTAAMEDVLPGSTEQSGFVFSPPEFTVGMVDDGVPDIYIANTNFNQTSLIFFVEFRAADAFVPCAEPGLDCSHRRFPDDTVAEVVVVRTEGDGTALTLTSRRPDGTAFQVHANGTWAPDLTVEDMFGFATVFTY